MTTDARPLAAHVDEAKRIVAAAREASVDLRVTGGVGVALRCPSASAPPLVRAYADIDAVGRRSQRREIGALFAALGYTGDDAFNALHGDTRLFFWDPANGRQLDVFLDRVEMCHAIDLGGRLDVDDRTLSLADLLLMKLQVVETNRKDFLDMLALLADHPWTDDEAGINLAYLSGLTAGDWGLWRTTTMVAERAGRFASDLEGFAQGDLVRERVQAFLAALEDSPKSRAWRLRARLGERKRWYELPEESH
jgi:hypothetical protein